MLLCNKTQIQETQTPGTCTNAFKIYRTFFQLQHSRFQLAFCSASKNTKSVSALKGFLFGGALHMNAFKQKKTKQFLKCIHNLISLITQL